MRSSQITIVALLVTLTSCSDSNLNFRGETGGRDSADSAIAHETTTADSTGDAPAADPLLLAASSQAEGESIPEFRYRIQGDHTNKVSRAEFVKGVDIAMATIGRYFNRRYTKTTGSAHLYITTSTRSPGGGIPTTTAWSYVGGNTIWFGINVGGDHESIRRTMLHELTHIFGFNYHPWQTQLRGNRMVDIGVPGDQYTAYDVSQLAKKGLRLRAGVLPPYHGAERYWWVPKPIANDDRFADIDYNASRVTLSPLANDQDPSGRKIAIASVTNKRPSNLNVSTLADGTIYFYPPKDAQGTFQFDYTVSNGIHVSAPATVTMIIKERPRFPWTNPVNALDVTGDGIVSSRDALVIINFGTAEVDPYTKPKFFYDVNGDGRVSSADALYVINRLGGQ